MDTRPGFECRNAGDTEFDRIVDVSDCNSEIESVSLEAWNGSTHKSDTYEFLLNSGTSNHMASDADWLEVIEKIERRGVVLGDEKELFSKHQGDLRVRTYVSTEDEYRRTLLIHDVLLVLGLHKNLLSCAGLRTEGFRVNLGRYNLSETK